MRPAVAAVRQAAVRAAHREAVTIVSARRKAQARRVAAVERADARRAAERRAVERRAVERRAVERRAVERRAVERRAGERTVRRSTVNRAQSQRTVTRKTRGASGRMAAVVAYARAQIGKRYARGAEGPHSFDCSGFTKRAYAQVGIRLPHSSGGQAARARAISRAQARPGDLVVGPGHVGVYMGGGMMIDAGNRRVGVVYRRLYAGLRVERL